MSHAQSRITSDQDAVIAEIDISAPPSRVFEALIDPGQLMNWFTDASCPVKFWKMDAKLGKAYSYATKKGGVVINGIDEFECHGEITEIHPPSLLVYTWIGNWHLDPERKTIVRWELTPTATGTHVKVTHSGLAQEPAARADYSGGWSGVMEKLKQFMETGKVELAMATTAITPDQDTIKAEVQIAAPPERVFQALTDPRQLMQWWGQKGMYHGTGWQADVRPGGQWRCDGVSDTDGKPFHVSGKYVDVDPPRLLSYTWLPSFSDPIETHIRWELEAANGGTIVRLQHSGFAGVEAAVQGHYQGWQRVIEWMRGFVERGETLATRPAVQAAPGK
jgi:uncharacterized protein YndB with AHSA1/START domain